MASELYFAPDALRSYLRGKLRELKGAMQLERIGMPRNSLLSMDRK